MKSEIMIEIVKKMSSDEEILDFIKIKSKDSDKFAITNCLRFLKYESSIMWVCELFRYDDYVCQEAIELLKSEDKAWRLIEKSGFDAITCGRGARLIKSERKILKMLKKSNYSFLVCKYAFPLLKLNEIMQIVRRKEYDMNVCEIALQYINNISDLYEIINNLKPYGLYPENESDSVKEMKYKRDRRQSSENQWHEIHEKLKSSIHNVLNDMTEDQILNAMALTRYYISVCKTGIEILKTRDGYDRNRIMKKTMYNDNVCNSCT